MFNTSRLIEIVVLGVLLGYHLMYLNVLEKEGYITETVLEVLVGGLEFLNMIILFLLFLLLRDFLSEIIPRTYTDKYVGVCGLLTFFGIGIYTLYTGGQMARGISMVAFVLGLFMSYPIWKSNLETYLEKHLVRRFEQ